MTKKHSLETIPAVDYNKYISTLSKIWNIPKQKVLDGDYDYKKYIKDNPVEALKQLHNLSAGNNAHFPDAGKSGIYKTKNHPTYPETKNPWNDDKTIFYPSSRQVYMANPKYKNETNTDRILDYLGSDLDYNKGATKAFYKGGKIMPTLYVTPKGSYTLLKRNKLNTGWTYKN